MNLLLCRTEGCGKRMNEGAAFVPPLKFFFSQGVSLEKVAGELPSHAYCPACSRALRRHGASLFPLPATRREIERRLERRRTRQEALEREFNRLQAFAGLLKPAKVTGSDGRPLVGAAAQATVAAALRPLKEAQEAAETGRRAEKAARRETDRARKAEKAERAEELISRLEAVAGS